MRNGMSEWRFQVQGKLLDGGWVLLDDNLPYTQAQILMGNYATSILHRSSEYCDFRVVNVSSEKALQPGWVG